MAPPPPPRALPCAGSRTFASCFRFPPPQPGARPEPPPPKDEAPEQPLQPPQAPSPHRGHPKTICNRDTVCLGGRGGSRTPSTPHPVPQQTRGWGYPFLQLPPPSSLHPQNPAVLTNSPGTPPNPPENPNPTSPKTCHGSHGCSEFLPVSAGQSGGPHSTTRHKTRTVPHPPK